MVVGISYQRRTSQALMSSFVERGKIYHSTSKCNGGMILSWSSLTLYRDHYEEVKAAAISGRHCSINHSAKNFYDFTSVDLSKIQYIDKALWFERTTVKFWVPRNEAHVSHSIINYQETAKFIQVETITMNDVIRTADIDVVDLSLVKLDIEGAEIEVIHDMLNNNIMPRQLLVEFDEMNKPNARSSGRIKEAINHLLEKGYILNFYDGRANCSFVLKQ
jgi:FkbM family methyltransferase